MKQLLQLEIGTIRSWRLSREGAGTHCGEQAI